MADWLKRVRISLEAGQAIDFATAPLCCITWAWLPTNDGPRRGAILKACKEKLGLKGTTVLIADPAVEAARASLAKALGQHGYSNIEPVRCEALVAAARKLAAGDGRLRLEAVLDFIAKCISGTDQAAFKKAIASGKAGGGAGAKTFGELIDLAIALESHGRDEDCLRLIEGFRLRRTANIFRQEMLRSMEAALRIRIADSTPLVDALWQVQNKISHAGRRIPTRAVGSTLLIKGLEFEHAVVVHAPSMNRKDWYVALTRATKTLTVLSPARAFTPPV
jgi:DNA helicase-2/ATP-dependent DNA helicase PcrA